jgi:hypothetical protein
MEPSSQSDRRKKGRTTQERRDLRTRLEGIWTETERARRIAEIREEHHDGHAITVRLPPHQRQPNRSPADLDLKKPS